MERACQSAVRRAGMTELELSTAAPNEFIIAAPMPSRSLRLLLPGALLVWCAAVIARLAMAMPLKHDEAAYVLGAQRLWAGEPPIWMYRSIGTELLAVPGVAVGSPTVIRIVFGLATLLVPIGAYALARAAFADRAIAGWTAAVIAGAHPMLLQNTEILSDLPSAGMILVGLAILVRELSRPTGASYAIVWAAPALAAGFYIRYGSLPALVATALATIIVYRRSIWARPRPFVALAVVAAVLLTPHLVFSIRHSGTLLGVLDESRHSTRLDYVGQGLVTYLTTNPFAYYGLLAGPLMVVGIGVGVVHRSLGARLIALVAAATFLMLGLFSHAQPRYAFLVVNLLVVLGVAGVVGAVRRLPPRPQRITAVVGAVLVASCAAFSVADVITSGPSRNRGANVILRLAEIVRLDAAGRRCEIDAERTPQLSYYSGCDPESSVLEPSRCHRRYLVPLPDRPIWPLPPGSPATTAVPDGDGILVIPCPAGAP